MNALVDICIEPLQWFHGSNQFLVLLKAVVLRCNNANSLYRISIYERWNCIYFCTMNIIWVLLSPDKSSLNCSALDLIIYIIRRKIGQNWCGIILTGAWVWKDSLRRLNHQNLYLFFRILSQNVPVELPNLLLSLIMPWAAVLSRNTEAMMNALNGWFVA